MMAPVSATLPPSLLVMNHESARLPTFSVIVESENLSVTDIAGLYLGLDSLARQDWSIGNAEQVMLLDSGDAPPDVLRDLGQRYPWLSVVRVDSGTDYYQAKNTGVQQASGEVVLFADSDCIYCAGWLRSMVEPFVDESVKLVGGETMISGQGIRFVANHLAFLFEGFSTHKQLYAATVYYANNLACRRDFLLHHPFPNGLPLYRGNCAIHRARVIDAGETIWRQPAAKAHHAPPLMNTFVSRYLLIGRDRALIRESLALGKLKYPKRSVPQKLLGRLVSLFRQRPLSALLLPFAAPLFVAAVGLILVGDWVTRRRVSVLRLHDRLERLVA